MLGVPLSPTTYVALFAASAVVSLVFAVAIKTRHDARGTKTLAYSFLGVGLWATNSAARTVVSDPAVTRLLLSTEMFLAVATARVWFIFAAQYTNQNVHRDRRVQLALYGLVTAALVVPLTNPQHGLMWTSITPVAEPFTHYLVAKGPAHYVLTVSGYGLVGIGLFFLYQMLQSTSHTKPAVSLILGFLLLVSVNAIPYRLDTTISHSTTLAPLGGSLFCLLCGVAIHYNMFTVTPIGRDRVFTAIRDPAVMLDRNRRIIDHNPAFAQAFLGGADATHEGFEDACPELTAALDFPVRGPTHVTVGDGRPDSWTYRVTASPLESGPHTLGEVLLFRDITDLLASQRELAKKDSQIDEFADSVAHELRNPLSVIIGHVDLLRKHLQQTESGEVTYDHQLSTNSLNQIESNGEQISEIVDDFLRVTSETDSRPDVEPLDFRRFVTEIASDHLPEETVDLPVEGIIYANTDQAGLLFGALFRNVAHRGGSTVTVEARLNEHGFVLEDTGRGVPQEAGDNLLEYGHTTRFRSEGLGLSVAKTIAEAHNWTISVDTDYENGLRVVVDGVHTDLEQSTPVEVTSSTA
jgi:signal transduction histidine kinase